MIKRYSLRKIDQIFSDKNRYDSWLKIEEAHIDYLSSINVLDRKVAFTLKSQFSVLVKKVREEEKRVNHDVVAFVNHLSDMSDSPVRKWIHYGLTSSDVVDSANGLILQQANDVFADYMRRLLGKLKRFSFRYKETYMPKFVDSKVDGLDSFGLKMAVYFSELKEAFEMFNLSRKHVECVAISGSMGINSHIHPNINDFVATRLGLYVAESSTQVVSRDRYFKHFSVMNRIVQTISRIALDLRFFNRSDLGIVSESFDQEQIGSSSMPHKKNPILLENICGLARAFAGYASTLSKNIQIWFERDLSHSSTDRIIFYDGYTLACQVVKRMAEVLKGLSVNQERLNHLIDKYSYEIYSKYACKLLAERGNKTTQEIEDLIGQFKEKMQKHGKNFRQIFNKSNFSEVLGKDTDSLIFGFEHHLPLLNDLYRRIFFEEYNREDFSTVYYDKDQILYAVDMLAQRLNYIYKEYAEPVSVVALMSDSVMFLSYLLPKLKFSVDLETVNVDAFRKDVRAGKKGSVDFDFSRFKDRKVLVIDVLSDKDAIVSKFASRIKSAVSVHAASLFVDQNMESRKYLDLYGLVIPSSKAVAGFGIGLDDKYRNCLFIGRVNTIFLDSTQPN